MGRARRNTAVHAIVALGDPTRRTGAAPGRLVYAARRPGTMNGNVRSTAWHWRLLGRLGTDVRVEETRLADAALRLQLPHRRLPVRGQEHPPVVVRRQPGLGPASLRLPRRRGDGVAAAARLEPARRGRAARAFHPALDRRRDREPGPLLVALRLPLGLAALPLLRLDVDRHAARLQPVLELGEPPARSAPGPPAVRVRAVGVAGRRGRRRPGRFAGGAIHRRARHPARLRGDPALDAAADRAHPLDDPGRRTRRQRRAARPRARRPRTPPERSPRSGGLLTCARWRR